MANTELRNAVAEALAAKGHTQAREEGAEEGTAPEGAEAEATPAPETPSSEVGAQSDGEAGEPSGSPEAEAAATADGTEELPDEYMGVPLSGLSAEERRAVIDGYKERDTLINKLMRERAEAEAATPPEAEAPAESPEEEFTDQAIAEALGLDLEDPYDLKLAQVAVPLARKNLELEAKVEQQSSLTAAQQEEVRWTKALDALEAQPNGALPVPREVLFKYALDHGIYDPEIAYWAIVGPTRTEVMADVEKLRSMQDRERRLGATTTRPRTGADTVAPPLKATDTKEAVAEAAQRAAKKLNISWDSAWKRSGLPG
jgi:hypothetical protein